MQVKNQWGNAQLIIIVVTCVRDSYCCCYRHGIFQNILSIFNINIISQTNNENMQSTGAHTPIMLKGPLFLTV
jgi:hypothetical protein